LLNQTLWAGGRIDAGLETLKSYYFNLGYLDFKVTDVKSDLSKDKQSIDVAIQIERSVIALRLSIIFLRLKILPVLSVRSFDKLSLDSFNIF
jgi:hypothetical protein